VLLGGLIRWARSIRKASKAEVAMLTEYLFVDEARLDSYASQLNPAGTVVEKTKELSAGLSLTGPKAEMKQSERVRQMTRHEKAELILNGLRAESSLFESRPESPQYSYDSLEGIKWLGLKDFVFERCEASKVIVPAKAVEGYDTPSFVFWLSPSDTRDYSRNILCLLEDFRLDDRKAQLVQASGYTILRTLVEYVHENLSDHNILLNDRLEDETPTHSFAPMRPSTPKADESTSDEGFLGEFLADYTNLFESWRCIVSRTRKIETLYRIREIGEECHSSIGIFGYPIWITAG
jgi:hypothetical protein